MAKQPLPERLRGDISEKEFATLVERAATRGGWLWNHIRPLKIPGRGGKFITPASTGFPDYVMVHERWPRLLALELKTERGPIAPQQKVWLNMLNALDGVDAFYARPSDWDRVVRYLSRPNQTPLVQPQLTLEDNRD